jgi:hypothetical protein
MDFRSDGIGGVPNFGVRVFPSGAKSFVLGYRLPDSRKQRWLTVGKVGVISLQKAREEARRILVEIGHGIDPKAEAKPKSITLKQYAPIFVDDMRTRGVRTLGEMERRINKHLVPSLGFYPASADTSEKVHFGPGGVSWQSERSTVMSSSVRRWD